MKVLLIKNVRGLGKAGDIKDVKSGYGENFLIKQGLAKIANDAVIKQHNAKIKQNELEFAKEIQDYKTLVAKLEDVTIIIKKKAGQKDSIFGSVTKEEVSVALKEQVKFDIDKKLVEFPHMIKSLGIFPVELHFHHGIVGEFKLEVVGE